MVDDVYNLDLKGGAIDRIDAVGDSVLIAVDMTSKHSDYKGSIIVSEDVDTQQQCTGQVISMGVSAQKKLGEQVKKHDRVIFSMHSGVETQADGRVYRIIDWNFIKCVLFRPDPKNLKEFLDRLEKERLKKLEKLESSILIGGQKFIATEKRIIV
jgi:co-chaperonin GroES (HSP10)